MTTARSRFTASFARIFRSIRSSLGAAAIAPADRRICGSGQDLRCHLRRCRGYKKGVKPKVWERKMTMTDKIEALIAGAILVIGLPALMFAVQ